MSLEAEDYVLEVQLYDFSYSHPDFSGVSSATFTSPTYVASPYGAWLADPTSSNPTQDTFSTWFRKDPVNFVFNVSITLKYDATDRSNRYKSV